MTADDSIGYGLLMAKGLAGPDGTETIVSPGPNTPDEPAGSVGGSNSTTPDADPSPSPSPSPSPPAVAAAAPPPAAAPGMGAGHWECGGAHNATS